MEKPRSHFAIVHKETTAEVLVLRDADDGAMSVTNDAERIVAYLHTAGILQGRRLLYYDSAGQLDELRHDGAGKFLGFAPGVRFVRGEGS